MGAIRILFWRCQGLFDASDAHSTETRGRYSNLPPGALAPVTPELLRRHCAVVRFAVESNVDTEGHADAQSRPRALRPHGVRREDLGRAHFLLPARRIAQQGYDYIARCQCPRSWKGFVMGNRSLSTFSRSIHGSVASWIINTSGFSSYHKTDKS